MGDIRRKSSERINLPKQEQDTLIPCPCCKGVGKTIVSKDGHNYRTKICKWCNSIGGVTKDTMRYWIRLHRWISYYTENNIPFRI